MNRLIPLSEIAVGERATVRRIDLCGGIRRRLMDIGLTPDTCIECVGKSPCGDPHAYLIRGAIVAIRCTDGDRVYVSKLTDVMKHGSD